MTTSRLRASLMAVGVAASIASISARQPAAKVLKLPLRSDPLAK
ncbi:MAG: hypothetical protein WC815_02230 [Vicinamibacterales bacterium]|jgi:hypothetical protein